jgi:hypothetical protein
MPSPYPGRSFAYVASSVTQHSFRSFQPCLPVRRVCFILADVVRQNFTEHLRIAAGEVFDVAELLVPLPVVIVFNPFFSELRYPQELSKLDGVGETDKLPLAELVAHLQPFLEKLK